MQLKKLFNNLDLKFFYLFVFLIPFQLSLFLGNTNKSLSFYNDFIGFWLYLSDILIILILIFGWRKLYVLDKTKSREIRTTLIAFLIWTITGILWAISPQIALYRAFRLLLLVLLFFYIKNAVAPNKASRLKSYFLIFIAGVIQSIIGIWQFIQQRSIGLRWIGEPVFNQTTAGIAKLDYNGEKLARAYGTFPHPNILGGFLFLAIVCGVILFIKTGHKAVIPAEAGISTIKAKYWIPTFVGILLIGLCLLLTFSRSAWIASGFFAVFVIVYLILKIKKSPTSAISTRISVIPATNKKYWIPVFTGITITLCVLYFSFPLIKNRVSSYQDAITTREFTTRIAIESIKKHPLLGIGQGNFIPQALELTKNQTIEQWQIQPVHNIYLLLFTELGIIGLALFLVFLSLLLKQSLVQIKNSPEAFALLLLFCGLLIIGLVDHYFLTLPQGMIIFWLSAGLLTIRNDH